jgi:uncharacterized protein YdeI (YjbR/CyaY-like superfamily)
MTSNKDPRIDRYIAAAQPFARPILEHVRDVVHRAEPRIEETLKWSAPHFVLNGSVCGMAAFKQHCALNFPKAELIEVEGGTRVAMGQFGRIASVEDLPPDDVLIDYVRRAVALNEAGVKTPGRAAPGKAAEPEVPEALRQALHRHPAAAAAFERMSPSHRREYVEWIAEAKRDATREKRVETAVEWITEGKSRNWKYQ